MQHAPVEQRSSRARGRHAPTSRGRWRRRRPPADTREAEEPVAEGHVLNQWKEASRSETKETKPNTNPKETRNTVEGGNKEHQYQLLLERGKPSANRKKLRITPVQSRLGVLRKKSQIYLSMGVGVRVFWKGE
jgi:hypothetical protein